MTIILTGDERAQTRAFLGYPQRFQQEISYLESAMDQIDQNDPQLILLRGYLLGANNIMTALTGAISQIGLLSLDNGGIVFDKDNAVMKGLRKEGRRWCNLISNLLAVEINSDAFGESGYSTQHLISTSNKRPIGGLPPLW